MATKGYNGFMRLFVLILALSIALPPIQAGACEMETNPVSAEHAGMMHLNQNNAPHDCCDTDQSQSEKPCNEWAQCGQCSSSVPAITVALDKLSAWNETPASELARCFFPPSHSHPPFRPPI